MSQPTPPSLPQPKVAIVRIVEVDLPWANVFWLTLKFSVAAAVISIACMTPVWLNQWRVSANAAQERRATYEAIREATDAADAAARAAGERAVREMTE